MAYFRKKTEKNIEVKVVKEKRTIKKMGNFDFNLMKGKLVESIVESIFKTVGFNVYSYGHESTLGKLHEDFKDYKSHNPVLKKIRSTPDFVVYSKEQEKAYLIEVKYSGGENDDFQADYEKYIEFWPECYILVVKPHSKNKYYIQKATELKPSKSYYSKTSRKQVTMYNINDFETIQKVFPQIGLKSVQDTFEVLESLVRISEDRK
jgi:hypothetical protein